NTSFPFTACGGRGGGGGGAIAIATLGTIEHLTLSANGADGSGSGTTTSRRGGSGSGGGICIASPLEVTDLSLTAIGGGQAAPTGKGGNGRTRVDAPTLNALVAQPTSYRGPTLDTITVAQGPSIRLGGSGAPGKTMLLFAKAERDIWRLIDSVVVGANARWQYNLPTPPGSNYL